ncbi:MAG TPA: GntR family transcriptional regulator [Paludibacter sp.]|jgi:DNA-binding transcriptional regulator YhcF (GntR family)|nr:GntR family transcriptional regulator [Paludibacter sp.]
MNIKFTHSISKIKSLADGISLSIMQGKIKLGDNLPSINEASSLHKVSRDTVFKAYNELKRRGLIDSNPTKGYFVTGEVNRVLLLLDTYSAFKQNLYYRFIANLPENYKVDLIFHQYNEHLFETILRESIGNYSMYVVMNFSNEHFSKSLKMIPDNKLLLLDFGNFEKSSYSYICQDFDQSFFDCLCSCTALLKKYKKFSFVFPEELCHPISSISYFVRFCKENNFAYEVFRRDADWHGVEAGTVYLCILPEDMVKIIKDADMAQLSIGSDIGLIAYNDNPILEVIKNGISSISINFGLMGEKAAEFVTNKKQIQEYLPTQLIIRNSI